MSDIANADESAPPTGIAVPPQVASFLKTTPNRLARLRSEGRGPAFTRLGRSIRYRWEDVHAFVEGNRQPTADGAAVSRLPATGRSEEMPTYEYTDLTSLRARLAASGAAAAREPDAQQSRHTRTDESAPCSEGPPGAQKVGDQSSPDRTARIVNQAETGQGRLS